MMYVGKSYEWQNFDNYDQFQSESIDASFEEFHKMMLQGVRLVIQYGGNDLYLVDKNGKIQVLSTVTEKPVTDLVYAMPGGALVLMRSVGNGVTEHDTIVPETVPELAPGGAAAWVNELDRPPVNAGRYVSIGKMYSVETSLDDQLVSGGNSATTEQLLERVLTIVEQTQATYSDANQIRLTGELLTALDSEGLLRHKSMADGVQIEYGAHGEPTSLTGHHADITRFFEKEQAAIRLSESQDFVEIA